MRICHCALPALNGEIGQTNFELSSDKWEEFLALLDRRARAIPEVKKLLTEPSVFDNEHGANI